MKCPICETIARFTPEEKAKAKDAGSILHICSHCGEEYEVEYADTLNSRSRVEELRATGRCIHCGIRKADEGYVSCKRCRDMKAVEFAWTKSIANEVAEERKKKQKKEKYEIDQLSKMAHEKHISYGTLVAILEGRIKMPKED